MSTLSPLRNVVGDLSYAACLEMFAAIYCSYQGSRVALQNLLNITGGGEILIWQYDPTAVSVDYSVCRQGDHYVIVLAGTTSKLQWTGNVIGGIAASYKGGITFVNTFWQLLLNTQKARVYAVLPPPGPGVRITLTGHSMGGAVAQLGANDLSEIYGADAVSLLTFSQPKALSGGYSGPMPTEYLRVNRLGDPVPYVPPRITGQIWTPFVGPGVVSLSSAIMWRQYGEGWLLRDDGSLTRDPGEYEGGWLDVARLGYLSFDAHRAKKIAELLARHADRV